MPESGPSVRCPPFLSVPKWDICDEEIAEWGSRMFGPERLAAYIAGRIRDGHYEGGRELFPRKPGEHLDPHTEDYTNRAMSLLAERGMVRNAGGGWHVICPGRMEPSIRRAVATILARRPDLPSALAAALDSWKHTLDTLDTLEAPGSTPASQVPEQRAVRSASLRDHRSADRCGPRPGHARSRTQSDTAGDGETRQSVRDINGVAWKFDGRTLLLSGGPDAVAQ